MTQEQILGNKLIATWMGYKTWVAENGTVMAEDDLTYAGHLSHFKCFQYHSDWNLLMPVVEKIENIKVGEYKGAYKLNINPYTVSIINYNTSDGIEVTISDCDREGSLIQCIYTVIIQFINRCNEQLASISAERTFNEAAAQFPNTLKKLPDTEKPEMHILYNPSGHEDSDSEERTLDREEMTRTEASKRNAVLRDSGSDNRWILDTPIKPTLPTFKDKI